MNSDTFHAPCLPIRPLALVAAVLATTACDPTTSPGPLAEPDAQESATETPVPSDTTAAADTTADDAPGDSTSSPEPDEPAGTLQPIDTLFASSMSGHEAARREVIADQTAWEEAWAELNAMVRPIPPTPEVDFDNHRVVLVAMGTRSTGGHAIGVESMTVSDGSLVVVVQEIEPGPTCITTQAITQPAFAVSIPDVGHAVEFEERSVVLVCD